MLMSCEVKLGQLFENIREEIILNGGRVVRMGGDSWFD